MADTSPQDACREAALRLLERRDHARRELARKLRQRNHEAQVIESVLDALAQSGLVDDAAFARSYVDFVLAGSRPVGRRKVALDLRRKGVDEAIVQQVLAERWPGDDEERERARRAAESKLRLIGGRDNPRRIQAKLYRFLAGRGFPPAVCRDIAVELCGESSEF